MRCSSVDLQQKFKLTHKNNITQPQRQPPEMQAPSPDSYSQKQVRQLNRYEDIFDVFLQIVILRMPTAFILINMTLMIWLVQTIYSSFSADAVPTSLYFFAPMLEGRPVTDLEFRMESECRDGWEKVVMKTFPTVTGANIKKGNLTRWKQAQILCTKRAPKASNFSISCSPIQRYCSGLCVPIDSPESCPITSIRRLYTLEIVLPSQQLFHTSADQAYKYVYSRESKNSSIVGISAQYEYRCANQFHYWDSYGEFGEYWNVTKLCGVEGYLSSEAYHPFDSMATMEFLYGNGLWSQDINRLTMESVTELGYVSKINFKNKSVECQEAETKAQGLSSKLVSTPLQPFYSKNLLIISFVLFTLCWAWLITAFCCQTSMSLQTKNIIVLLLSAIEFIAIAFINYQNLKLVWLQNEISSIASCIDSQMSAFQHWNFGISNRYPLICLIFLCSSFLLMQFISYFYSCCIYVSYQDAIAEDRRRRGVMEDQGQCVSVEESDT